MVTAQQASLKIPFPLVLLDGAGALLLGLGLAERFGEVDILSGVLDFPHRADVLIGVGALMMLPLLFFILNTARARAESAVKK